MSDEVAYLIELRGVYDGWSVARMTDGSLRNRWANEDGTPREGYERRFEAAQKYIEGMEATDDEA